ncbi:J domain-containing protein [Kribbella sp. NPDC049584]|uniref:J domain-containing protein n=1 Tax=Kribbella sp. NPDC049584 TaxID=3154833 RepID=UPI003446EEDC
MKSPGQTDLYKVLHVAADADAHQLDQAFRALARRHHPDAQHQEIDQAGVNTSEPPLPDSQHFQEILAAYAVLRDPVARAAYDNAKRPTTQATPAVDTAAESAYAATDRSWTASRSPEPALRVGPVRWAPIRRRQATRVTNPRPAE